MKTWITFGAVVAVVGAVYAAYALTRPDLRLDVVRPRTGVMEAFVEEQARTHLPRDYLIAMPIDGWLEPITLREGDAVAAGEIVARLDTADLKDREQQALARIARLENKIRETEDDRLEQHALEETQSTVEAIDQTVLAAEAKLAATKAVMDFAEAEVERLEQLEQEGATTERELRQAITEFKKAEAEYRSDVLELTALRSIAAASHIGPQFIRDYIDRKSFTKASYARELDESRAELQIVRRNLGRTQVASPVDGVVLERLQWRKQFLPAGTPLLTIGRLEELEVIADVLTEQAGRIAPGDAVEVFGEAIADGPISGTVSRVYPAGFTKVSSLGVEQQRVNVTVDLDERPEVLGVGFRVYVRIIYDRAADALILPRTALFRGEYGDWQVIAVRDGRARFQPVQVGLLNNQQAQIVSGLTGEAQVVARPSSEIEAGQRVQAATQSKRP